LGAGVVYGFYHQRTITASTKKAEARREYEHRQELIQKAKDEYTKSKQPASSTQATGGSTFEYTFHTSKALMRPGIGTLSKPLRIPTNNVAVKQDPMSPNFDMEAFMNALMEQKS
jgi:F-type H+-transporting ATP synthase subunit e